MQGSVPGVLIRGGTSKGLFVRENDLPEPGPVRDELLLELFGSPDPLQVDGIGGSRSHTSKLMIVSPSDRDQYDVEYTFAQIGVTEPDVDWSKNCGNLTSAIGTFAVLEGLVPADGDAADLTLYNTNTDTVVEQTVPLDGDEPDVYGDYSIDGVPGTGARIDTTFVRPGGGVTGLLLPTGNPTDEIQVDGDTLEVSLVDATNLVLYIRASDLGMTGTELPDEIEARPNLLETFRGARETVRDVLGLEDAKKSNPSIGIVSEPQSYECSVDRSVDAADIDVTTRWISLQPHHAVGMTGAMCIGAASRVPGTLPNQYARQRGDSLTLGHPKGTVTVDVDVTVSDGEATVESITNRRTARPLVHGRVYHRHLDELEQLRE